MLLLVSGATTTVNRHISSKYLGVLLTPQAGNKPHDILPFAADNAAFSNWSQHKFEIMISSLVVHDPMWVACPDVVGDAKETYSLFKFWQPLIKLLGLPVAYVLQNGQELIGVPWDDVDALFIGGDNDFKLGKYAEYITGKARMKGKMVHMGRVNSIKRIKYAIDIGCTSIDGTSCSKFPDVYIPKFLNFIEDYIK